MKRIFVQLHKTENIEKLLQNLFEMNEDHQVNSFASRIQAFSKLVTLVENSPSCFNEIFSNQLFKNLNKKKPHIIGITGLPGSGKSSLTNLLIRKYRNQNKKICVFAVDPSSQINKGAILGDRIRMHEHFKDDFVYIRSLGSRGALGGLSKCVRHCLRLAQVLDFDIILVETVGIGQSESDIVTLADTTVLVLMPETGDEIQLMKSGILQMAQIYVVNKIDLHDPSKMIIELQENLSAHPKDDFPCVLKTSFLNQIGIDDLFQKISDHKNYIEKNQIEILQQKQKQQIKILGIHHIGIAPKVTSETKNLFQNLFSLPFEGNEEVENQKVITDFFKCGETSLELLTATSQDSTIAQFLNKKGSGIHHIALEVNSLKEWMIHLKKNNIQLIDENPRQGAHHTQICFLHPKSTGGILIELVEKVEL